jgi:hypothetical protein
MINKIFYFYGYQKLWPKVPHFNTLLLSLTLQFINNNFLVVTEISYLKGGSFELSANISHSCSNKHFS